MRTTIVSVMLLITCGFTASAQDHGSLTYKGQTIALTGYRTRFSDQKRWIIAEGKKDGKLYSCTVTLLPDVTGATTLNTDAKHTVTLTISNTDYSHAQNLCFDGGSPVTITPKGHDFAASGKDMTPGDCFGKSTPGDKASFTIKP